MGQSVRVREVGPRDGLQMCKAILSTDRKIEWCHRATAAGIKEIEATSFVPPHVIAQFSDAADVARAAMKIQCADISALVVNLKGAQRAFDAGLSKVNYVVSASEAHSLANARRSTAAALDEFELIVEETQKRGISDRVTLNCAVATAFGCTIQGHVAEGQVLGAVERLARAGAGEITLADTVGYADPWQVKRLFASAAKITADLPLAAHFHDTRGLGLANVTAAIESGVRRFDASLGGLGGCPFAPGATGNINTEDCVFLLETLGFDSGVNLDRLLELRADVQKWLPDEKFVGAVARAGVPKTFTAPLAVP